MSVISLGRRLGRRRVVSIPRRPPVWEHSGAGEQEAAMPADDHRTLAGDSCLRSQDGALYSMVIDCFVSAVCNIEVCESGRRRGRLGVCHDCCWVESKGIVWCDCDCS